MNALPHAFSPPADLRFMPMGDDNLSEVMEIERAVYPFPWSRKVFVSTLLEGHDCQVARDPDGRLVGYFVLMPVVDEAHLLNIAVRPDRHGRGIGYRLMEQVIERARVMGATSLLLEVRPSNRRAIDLYLRFGFTEIGRRKDYYQADNGTREEAIVMRLPL